MARLIDLARVFPTLGSHSVPMAIIIALFRNSEFINFGIAAAALLKTLF